MIVDVIEVLVKILLVVLVFSMLGGFATYIERKVLARFQQRVGPSVVGPFGLLQILADGIKLFTKEDIVPSGANRLIFRIAPVITAATAFIAMAPIPFLPNFEFLGRTITPIISDINVGILFFLSVGAAGMYGPLLGGISANSKWSILGAARTAVQLLSFEVVSGLSLLSPLMLVGSLSLVEINRYQSGGITDWLIFSQPLAFLLFLFAGYAELNRTPFDLLEHEAEVVSGYATEYAGMRWGMFFIGEYASMFSFSFVVSLIFLGGFNPLWLIPGGIAIILKVAFFIFLFMWARAAYPHVRPDQLMGLCWRVLFPLALLNVFITGIVCLGGIQ